MMEREHAVAGLSVAATSDADSRLDALALACVKGVGPVAFRQRLLASGDARAALEASTTAPSRDAARAQAERLLDACRARGVDVVVSTEARYPQRLRHLEDAPSVLFALGSLASCEGPSVALVGSRRATAYGRRVARGLAAALAHAGVCVVSGLAAGIDAESHTGCLDGDGRTVAVLGTGVDVPYPRGNAPLHAAVAKRGLVLSELPPGRGAHAGAFPRRNRLIAALADVVVVVEAGTKSGALITAQAGFALGRMVGAVPGPVDVDTSRGANLLLRDGAHVIASVEDVLGLLALAPRGAGEASAPTADAPRRSLGPASDDAAPDSSEGRLLAILSHGPQLADDLVRAAGLSPREVGAAIATLTLAGAVRMDAAGLVERLAWSARPS
ncbi:MAG: DNA-processing protein DprA [Gemmatimonadaceae bacterium]